MRSYTEGAELVDVLPMFLMEEELRFSLQAAEGSKNGKLHLLKKKKPKPKIYIHTYIGLLEKYKLGEIFLQFYTVHLKSRLIHMQIAC